MSEQLNWQRDNFENDFTAWEGDLWDRQRLGKQLTNYVDRLQCGAVLALDARWGEGKTWFVRHWKKHLEDQSHQVVYLDSFANDYLDDPFLTIAAEISHALKDADEIADADIQDFNSKTASVLISLAAVMPLIAAKAGLHWVGLGGAGEALQEVYKEGKEVYDTASEEIANKVKEHIEKKIENHHIEKQTIQDFKQELAELAAKLEKPLVFIIDELDRCRPDFSIRLIERIKHFFDIPKIVFVLVMDKTQFSKVICHNYGYGAALGEEYLDKFIDFSIRLRLVINHDYTERAYIENCVKEILDEIGLYGVEMGLIRFISVLFEYHNKNTRQLRKILNQFSLLKFDEEYKDYFLIYLIFNPLILEENSFDVIKEDLYKLVVTQLPNELEQLDLELYEKSGERAEKEDLIKLMFSQYFESKLLNKISYNLTRDGFLKSFQRFPRELTLDADWFLNSWKKLIDFS